MKLMKVMKKSKAAPSQEKKAKSTLLQTYFTSLLCLVLCVTMFFGTSYAWFTSEVTNEKNEIYIGILDVGLYKHGGVETVTDGESQTQKVKLQDLSKEGNKLFDGNIRWEPGFTATETVEIVNEGDLAFKYALTFGNATLKDALLPDMAQTPEQLMAVAKWFDVWVFQHGDAAVPNAASYRDILAENSGWVNAGTLDKLLSGDVVLSGAIGTVRGTPAEGKTPNEGTTDGLDTTHTYTVALHMNEDADITVMGKRITLDVKLTAYQLASEQDAFGGGYDHMVATAEELKDAFAIGGSVALAADIHAKDVLTLAAVAEGVKVDLYLNGHEITAELKEPVNNSSEMFYVYPGGKLTIHDNGNGGLHAVAGKSSSKVSAIINNCGGTVVINGGTYTMEYGSYEEGYLIPTIIDNNSTLGASTVIINGGTFTHTRNMFRNFSNHSTAVASIIINGGTFNGAENDFGSIWNQKASASVPSGAGIVDLNGGVFHYMNISTGFVSDNGSGGKNPQGVTLSSDCGLELPRWDTDGNELVAEIKAVAPAAEAAEG